MMSEHIKNRGIGHLAEQEILEIRVQARFIRRLLLQFCKELQEKLCHCKRLAKDADAVIMVPG